MSSLKREQIAFYWGLVFIATGVVVILVVLYLEAVYHPTKLLAELALRFFGHLGIASLLLGMVGIIVEFKNWSDYFEERLASIIRKKEFLQTLERNELKSLLRAVFQAYYRVRNLVYEDSFLEFFNTKLQDYIAFPFREDVRNMITIHEPTPDECCLVQEDISYKCRKVDVESSTIQKDIKWSTDYSDVVGELKDYYVALQLPDRVPKTFSPPAGLVDGRVVFKKGDQRVRPIDGAHGFEVPIQEFKDIDELHVQIHLEYMIPVNKFFAWVMNYPSRGLQAVFHYPKDVFVIEVETFGMDAANMIETRQPGLYSLTYDSWLLPDYGLSYQFRKRTAAELAAPTTAVAAPCNVGDDTAHKENDRQPAQAAPE